MRRSSSLLIDEQPLQVIPTLACKIGLNRATFLQQLHYWLQKPGAHEKDGQRWVFNTYEEWHEQFPFWSVNAIKKLVLQLEQKGVIETTDRYNKRKTDRTKWYTINYEVFNALFDSDSEGAESSGEGAESSGVEGAESTERYQESTETTNRDSDLQSGEPQKDKVFTSAPPKPGKIKPEQPGAFAVRELMDRVNAARDRGAPIHDPPSPQNYGAFFKNRMKRHDIETLLKVLDYLVAKASGEIENEPKAWCGFDTALDAVLAGWRPKHTIASLDDKRRQRLEAEQAENDRLLRELMEGEANA